jgi:hypothetical protein
MMLARLRNKGLDLRSVHEGLDTKGLVFLVLGPLLQFTGQLLATRSQVVNVVVVIVDAAEVSREPDALLRRRGLGGTEMLTYAPRQFSD